MDGLSGKNGGSDKGGTYANCGDKYNPLKTQNEYLH
jgi:hypothetical protein